MLTDTAIYYSSVTNSFLRLFGYLLFHAYDAVA